MLMKEISTEKWATEKRQHFSCWREPHIPSSNRIPNNENIAPWILGSVTRCTLTQVHLDLNGLFIAHANLWRKLGHEATCWLSDWIMSTYSIFPELGKKRGSRSWKPIIIHQKSQLNDKLKGPFYKSVVPSLSPQKCAASSRIRLLC